MFRRTLTCLLAFGLLASAVFAADLAETRKKAEQGNVFAQFILGDTYATGDGVPKDAVEAVKWYRLAAEQGYAAAHYTLGVMYDNGDGVPKDQTEAVKWFRKAAEPPVPLRGLAMAQYYLGVMYATGDGVAMLRLARKLRPRDRDILFNLGMALSDLGELDEAIDCLTRASESSPKDASVLNALGVAHSRAGRDADARAALERAVQIDPNDPYCLRNLGGILLQGRGAEKTALEHLLKATSQLPTDPQAWLGVARAHENLGDLKLADDAYLKVLALAAQEPIAEQAKSGRSRIAAVNFRAKGGKGLRLDAVMYCQGALERFSRMSPKEIEQLSVEIAILGTRGLDVNDPAQKYSIRSLPGAYSGLHLLCIEYVGFKLVRPEIDLQFDLAEEFSMAKRLIADLPPS